jgi:hypothetical protein
LTPGAEYQEVEVHLRRQKSGFGFRILGGDEAGQPVSPDTREKARMRWAWNPVIFPSLTHYMHI